MDTTAGHDQARLLQMLGEERLHAGLGVPGSEGMELYGVAKVLTIGPIYVKGVRGAGVLRSRTHRAAHPKPPVRGAWLGLRSMMLSFPVVGGTIWEILAKIAGSTRHGGG